MAEAYIVDAVRTPTGRRKGGLADVHGDDLGAHVLKTLVDRNANPDNDYDDVEFCCGDPIGPLPGDLARTCGLSVRLIAASCALRSPGDYGRRKRCGCGRRCSDHDPDSYFLRDACG